MVEGQTFEAACREALGRLVEKRLRKFASLAPKVLEADDPETVHDVRVSSRRLQQGLAAYFPKPRPGKVRRLRRTLRKVRRALGEWRDCDVLLALATAEQEKARGDEQRMGWELVREFLRERRHQQISSGREKLLKHDVTEFSGRVGRLLDSSSVGTESGDFARALRLGIERACAHWQSDLARARTGRAAESLHALRIATKRLRYRSELARDLGDETSQLLIRWLKELQDGLGHWHDRQALHQTIAAALACPEILLREPVAVRALLAEVEKDKIEQEATLAGILRLAGDESRHAELTAWLGSGQYQRRIEE